MDSDLSAIQGNLIPRLSERIQYLSLFREEFVHGHAGIFTPGCFGYLSFYSYFPLPG
jgi:hypothetical protein